MNARLLICAAALWSAAAAAQQPAAPPTPVSVRSVIKTELAPTSWVPGSVLAAADARVSAEVSGRLVWVAEVGTRVAQGDSLARGDDAALRIEKQTQGAVIERLQAQLKYREQQVQRYTQLAAKNVAAGDQLDSANSELAMTRADLSQARARLAEIDHRLNRSNVRAPFDGVVVARLAQPGEYLNPGTPVVRLVDVTHREISAQVPLAVFSLLKDGDTLSVRHGGQTLRLPVRSRIGVGDPTSRSAEVRMSVGQEDWVVGSAVEVGVPEAASKQVLAVHRDAILLRSGQRFVYRVGESGKAERVEIREGL
ncbi:MAG: efflux RND transporter periplasmic adaptor subunit, partial [Xanthomonadales bacterium]|nr:efflux RND transporter periplasmic adaptor subunit [Xanthomonadales bacterium]